MLGLAFVGLIVVTLGVAAQAQSAQAAELTRAKELAIAQVGDRVGIGAAGVDVTGIRDAAAASLAAGAVRDAQALAAEAGAELGDGGVTALASLRRSVIGQVGVGGSAVAVTSAVRALRTEQVAVSSALAAHREAVAARLAAEAAAAAEAARVAAEQAAAEAADDSWSADVSVGSDAGGASAGTAAAADPYTAEFYPGLPAAPRDEDCGPCTGKEMHPVYYNGKYVWGCAA
ncbi:hypothetical protein DCE93_12275 [Agromyces badenianii]|uniref:Uncharacterized protein n=1 Tax=Agromyces badenianii TaxID=2080742 RepID=A0A2S0WY95_9MICO|nr:hypothetical protein [Agromyces badenianii]AWB96329.1 hypothetical protein DCE93_12275 [Agromyces badenianii]